jgi:translation initiation factor 1
LNGKSQQESFLLFLSPVSNKNKNKLGVVYSTNPDYQYMNPDAEESQTLPNKQQQLRVRIEKNHRGGKTVTVVDGFTGTQNDLELLAKTLKQKCGTGGSAKDGLILIQGEMKERVVKLLNEMGYKAK